MQMERDADIPAEHAGTQSLLILKISHPAYNPMVAVSVGTLGVCAAPHAAATGLTKEFGCPVEVLVALQGISEEAALRLETFIPGIHDYSALTRSNLLKSLLADRQ